MKFVDSSSSRSGSSFLEPHVPGPLDREIECPDTTGAAVESDQHVSARPFEEPIFADRR
jgi:hypothetical protein